MSYDSAKDGKHYWLTPPEIFKKLNDEFHFDFDPCPYPKPEGFDGLTIEWGKSNYVNPPFKGPTKWVYKAIREYGKGKKVVFVFPLDKWVLMMIEFGAEIRNLGDIRWLSTEKDMFGNHYPGHGTGRWIGCFILDPKKQEGG
jgi:hypothetical protein